MNGLNDSRFFLIFHAGSWNNHNNLFKRMPGTLGEGYMNLTRFTSYPSPLYAAELLRGRHELLLHSLLLVLSQINSFQSSFIIQLLSFCTLNFISCSLYNKLGTIESKQPVTRSTIRFNIETGMRAKIYTYFCSRNGHLPADRLI